MEHQAYELPAPLLQELLAYLAGKPFREVAGAMQALQGLSPVQARLEKEAQ